MAAALESPLVAEASFDHALRVVLVHSTRASKLGLAAAMDHLVEGPEGTDTVGESGPDVGRVTVAADLADGECLRVVKFLAYAWSSQRSHAALRDEVIAACRPSPARGSCCRSGPREERPHRGRLGGVRCELQEPPPARERRR